MKQNRIILAAFVLSFMVWNAQATQLANNILKVLGAQFQWNATSVDVGQIKQNNPKTVSFDFKNVGDQPLIITEVKGSCGCTATSTDLVGKPIAPQETAKISATYNASSLGKFNKTVTVTSNAAGEPVTLNITGEVVE